MKRRDYLIGGATAAAVIGAIGTGTAGENLLTGQSNRVTPTMPSTGVFDYGTDGIDRVFWRERGPGRGANMVLGYQSAPPSYVRLTAPDGTREFVDNEPAAGGTSIREFNVPFTRRGTWTISAEHNGTYTTFDLPLNPTLQWGNYGLDRNTLVIQASNPTHTPNWAASVAVLTGNQTTKFDLERRLMPGDGFVYEAPYPFDTYRDVHLKLFDGVRTYDVTTDLV